MFKFLERFLSSNKGKVVYTKTYREGYNRLWINNIRDYSP